MKAGIRNRSAKLSQRSLTISEVRTRPSAARACDQRAQDLGAIDDVGIGQQQIFGLLAPTCAASMPCLTAHSLPVQPGGSGRPATTCSRSDTPSAAAACRARSAVRRCCRRPLGRSTMRPDNPDAAASRWSRRCRRPRCGPGSPQSPWAKPASRQRLPAVALRAGPEAAAAEQQIKPDRRPPARLSNSTIIPVLVRGNHGRWSGGSGPKEPM